MATFENLNIVLGRDDRGRIFGTNRDDLAYGNQTDDIINLRAGNDILFGQGGDDLLIGLAGEDILVGGSGNDELRGGQDSDTLDGQAGNDTLRGQGGDDLIRGRAGDDTIGGGTGDDLMVGGSGRDQFFFDPSRPNEGADRISDFALNEDRIVLDAQNVLESDPGLADAIVAGGGDVAAVFAALDASDVWDLRTASNGDLIIVHPNGTIRLAGVPGNQVTGFADLADALTINGLGEALVDTPQDPDIDPPRPATITEYLTEESEPGFDDNGGDFDILLASLEEVAASTTAEGRRDLAELAVRGGRSTLMAPDDDAFLALSNRLGGPDDDEQLAFEAILDTLETAGGGDAGPLLSEILRYHVVDTPLTLGELQGIGTVETILEGSEFQVENRRVIDEEPDFPDASVTTADVLTGNGLVHVINEVLLPFDA